MKIQAPNGLVFDLPEAVASGLVASEGNGFSLVDEPVASPEETEPTPEVPAETPAEEPPAPAPVKRGPGRPRKNP